MFVKYSIFIDSIKPTLFSQFYGVKNYDLYTSVNLNFDD